MQKVGVVTFLHNDNYGSSLQAYALQRVVTELGYDCIHMDYHPDTKEKILNMLKTGNDPKLILDGLKKKKVKVDNAGARIKSGSFSDFYGRHMRFSPVCHNRKEMQQAAKEIDILICGSDQIWSPVWFNPVYFLNFSQGQKKIAYAPSLGVAKMTSNKKKHRISMLLQNFDSISVREEEGAKLIRKLCNQEITVTPDPVCLLSGSEWRELAEKTDRTDYILCYFIGESEDYWKRVKKLQKQTGCDVLVLPVTAASYEQGYELLDGASPEQFLGYIVGAKMVCTDSFHCTVFSTLLGTEVKVFRRYRENDPESKNSRIDQWLRLTGNGSVKEREEKAAALREQGRSWLKAALGD